MKNKELYLGFDTSNYTTSVALCNAEGEVIANIKRILDVGDGERGLRQSDAVFAHVKNMPSLADMLAEHIGDARIAAVGVSTRPRDVEGSYMPCFLVGRALACAVAATHGAPVLEFSHQSGHIAAALYSSGMLDSLIGRDFVAFHVSGGTTEALYVRPSGDAFSVELIAATADISAGQAIDRAGVMMGLKFPCGRELERLASQYLGDIPRQRICVRGGSCNLSGLENMSRKLFDETGDRAFVSACVLDFVGRTLSALTENIRDRYPDIPIVYAGGVMSNRILKGMLAKYPYTYFSEPEFSADNAAGIAILTERSYRSNDR